MEKAGQLAVAFDDEEKKADIIAAIDMHYYRPQFTPLSMIYYVRFHALCGGKNGL